MKFFWNIYKPRKIVQRAFSNMKNALFVKSVKSYFTVFLLIDYFYSSLHLTS